MNFHPVLKNFLLIVLGYVIFVVGTEAGARVKWLADQWQIKRAVKAMDAWKEAERKDVYGGKTPDETLALFTDALKKGDYNLAEKYLGSVDARTKFKKMRDEGGLLNYLINLGTIEKSSSDPGYYMFVDREKNILTGTMRMDKNLNNIWKITNL